MEAIWLALFGAVAYGVADFVGGVASRKTVAIRLVVLSFPVSVALVAGIAIFVDGELSLQGLAWGFASGVAGGVAMWWFYRAMAIGPMAVISPITAVLTAGIPVIAGGALGERPATIATVGVALALAAVVLVTYEPGVRGLTLGREAALLTLGSGTSFGLAFVCLHQIEAGGGLYPLLAARIGSAVVIVVVAAAIGELRLPERSVMHLALLAGGLEVTATAALMFALQGSLLSLVGVIGSLYPLATVVLAVVVLRERLRLLQIVGLVGALGAVALIAVGSG